MKTVSTERPLQEALLRLLREKPLSDISVTELCLEAGVGRASFYRHYKNLGEVLDAYEQRLAEEAIERTRGSKDQAKDIEQILRIAKREAVNIGFLSEQLVSHEIYKFLLQFIREELEQYGLYQNPYQLRYIAGGMSLVLGHWVSGGCRESVPHMRDIILGFPLYET